MSTPRIGVSLPHFGPYAGPDSVATIAKAAERLGFHAVSVTERLLMPVGPGWDNGAGLPEAYVWDPLEVLTWAAAHTSRIRLATTIVNTIFQPPIVLARRLATLDQLSRGRLDAGLGQGGGGTPESRFGIPEEFVAAGVPVSRRGGGFEEHLAAMRACWGPDPVEFRGSHYEIPPSTVGPKPYAGRIPVLLGGNSPAAVRRAARIADGFITVGHPAGWDDARRQAEGYREAGGTGRLVVLAIQPFADASVSERQFVEAVRADLERTAAIGGAEMHFTLNLLGMPPARQVELLEALSSAGKSRT
ncbi:TIGR03619 family F420-dependent LLM class oxidoreductase [Fodinicola acaciae]|uniref:TIGR03619 family F420-dependent LLM class oxidoreductase n=1 Tax=Fodinicola acaciae TaxID=2681555 RepID=UPI0013D379D7|nr:TIGR03619 family F420-dependent LLM class oxidoreductase [Fodinicola acaciae]